MHLITISRIIGMLLMVFSLTMALPAALAAIYQDGALHAFGYAFALTFSVGLVLWLISQATLWLI